MELISKITNEKKDQALPYAQYSNNLKDFRKDVVLESDQQDIGKPAFL